MNPILVFEMRFVILLLNVLWRSLQ